MFRSFTDIINNLFVLSAVSGQEISRESRLIQLPTCGKLKTYGKHNIHFATALLTELPKDFEFGQISENFARMEPNVCVRVL